MMRITGAPQASITESQANGANAPPHPPHPLHPPYKVATVAVRDLAAFVHRRGDIHHRYTGSATAAEGIGAQRRAQPQREGYRRELPVAATVVRNGVALSIRGRIDGIDEAARVIEEYKTTRSEVAGLHAHIGHLHLAQLKLYAALLNAMDEATRPEFLDRFAGIARAGADLTAFLCKAVGVPF